MKSNTITEFNQKDLRVFNQYEELLRCIVDLDEVKLDKSQNISSNLKSVLLPWILMQKSNQKGNKESVDLVVSLALSSFDQVQVPEI